MKAILVGGPINTVRFAIIAHILIEARLGQCFVWRAFVNDACVFRRANSIFRLIREVIAISVCHTSIAHRLPMLFVVIAHLGHVHGLHTATTIEIIRLAASKFIVCISIGDISVVIAAAIHIVPMVVVVVLVASGGRIEPPPIIVVVIIIFIATRCGIVIPFWIIVFIATRLLVVIAPTVVVVAVSTIIAIGCGVFVATGRRIPPFGIFEFVTTGGWPATVVVVASLTRVVAVIVVWLPTAGVRIVAAFIGTVRVVIVTVEATRLWIEHIGIVVVERVALAAHMTDAA